MKTKRKLATLAIATLVLSAMVGGIATAQTTDESSPVDDLLTVEENDAGVTASAKRGVSSTLSFLDGLEKRISYGAMSRVGFGDDWTASEKAQTLQDRFNSHNASYESYVNNRTNASTSYDVIRVTILKDGENATVYLTADVKNDSYTNATMVDSTNRNVDHYVTMCGLAAKDAPKEMKQFRTTFVENDKDLNRGYVIKLTSKYKGYVASDMLGNETACQEEA